MKEVFEKKDKNQDFFTWGCGKEADSIRTMTSKDLSISINKILKGQQLDEGVWVFGYGSLMWNPDFEVVKKISGEVSGYQRSLCLKSLVYRGTHDYHGLVFGLDDGLSCQGMCFLIAPDKVKIELQKVWEREMFAGTYIPTWVKVKTRDSIISAVTFVINNEHEHYIPNLELEEVVERVLHAEGKCGSCYDYVKNTVKHLHQFGLRDESLEQLLSLIKLTKSNENIKQ